MKAWMIGVIAILLLAFGFASGWHIKSLTVKAAEAKQDRQAVKTITTSVVKQSTALEDVMTQQQTDTSHLLVAQSEMRQQGTTVRTEIASAKLTPPPVPQQCPDPVATDEFEQLYNRAAKNAGDPPAAAAEDTR